MEYILFLFFLLRLLGPLNDFTFIKSIFHEYNITWNIYNTSLVGLCFCETQNVILTSEFKNSGQFIFYS